MHVLIIGGNRFVGKALALHLLFRRHRVTVLNRGTLPSVAGVEQLRTTVQHLIATWSVPPPGYADRTRERRLPA